jgi:hypothetical protein
MLLTRSNEIRYSQREISQAKFFHSGKLSRLLLKFRSPWHVDYALQKPRRSIDRELQERWPKEDWL